MTGIFVNKLIVDKDDAYETIQTRKIIKRPIHVLRYTGDEMGSKDIRKFIEIIYKNFEELNEWSELNHNRTEIARVLTSPDSIIIIATLYKRIVGYLIAEEIVVNQKKIMHIHYIFTTPVRRKSGIATYMLNLIQKYTLDNNIHELSLTFDTYNKKLENFYYSNHFKYDTELRSYQRHDMLVKNI
jgi:RimJ/RimL family protein N-acetyltransferase